MNTIRGEETKNEHNTRKRNTIRGDETKNEHNTWRRNEK